MKLASAISRSLSEEEIRILRKLSSKLSGYSTDIALFVSSIKNSDVTRLVASGELMKKLTDLDGAVDKAKSMEELNNLLVGEKAGKETPVSSGIEKKTTSPPSDVAKLKEPVDNLVKDIKEQADAELKPEKVNGGRSMRDIIKEALNNSPLSEPPSSSTDAATSPLQGQEDNSLVAILNMANLGQFIEAMVGQGKTNITAVLSDLDSSLKEVSNSTSTGGQSALSRDLREKVADIQQASTNSAQAIEEMKKQINVVLQSLKSFVDFAKTSSPSESLQSLQTAIDALVSGINEGIKDVNTNS
jgi:hypothetical protein